MGKEVVNMKTTTANTEQQRTRLLSMIRGDAPVVLLYNVGYMLVATEAERATEPTAGVIAMPAEADALRRVYEAVHTNKDADGSGIPEDAIKPAGATPGGKAGLSLATIHHYGEDAADEDIRAAMDAMPCLVNYGGTLRAHNLNAGGCTAAIILKDMQP